MNTLGLLNAQLGLRYELLRAVTPKCSEYKYTTQPNFEAISQDGTIVAKTLRKLGTSKTKNGKWKHIDVDQAAQLGHFPRALAVQKLQEWNDRGAIELVPSGVVHRFRILQPLPSSAAAKKTLTAELYTHFLSTEASNMDHIQRVITFLTSPSCLTRALASHFGDDLAPSLPSNGCGHCNFCTTGTALPYQPGNTAQNRKGRINPAKFKAVLKATTARDDARYLARIAFGISSPRVTLEKLGRHVVFGSMAECDFEVCSPLLCGGRCV